MSGMDFSDPAVIASLTAALEAAGVDGIEIEQGATKLRIVVDGGSPTRNGLSQQNLSAPETTTVNAPIAGVFVSHHPASDQPSGDVSGFIQVGPMLVPVRAAGTLTRTIAIDGTLVGYGDSLFEIETRP